MSDKQTIDVGNELTQPLASAEAFLKWRGEKPTTGYGYDLMHWDYETRDMRKAWDAAVRWSLSQNQPTDATHKSPAEGGRVQ